MAYKRPRISFKKFIRAAAGAATQSAMKSGTSRTRTQTTRSSTSSAPLTGHHDFKTDYVKKRPSRRTRRNIKRKTQWRKSIIKTVRESTVGSSHVIRRSFQGSITSAVDASNSFSYMMYGLNGESNTNINTTNDIGATLFAGAGTAWTNWNSTTLTAVDHKLYSQHASLEFNMSNTGTTDLWAEVYYIRARRRVEAVWLSPNTIFNQGFLKQGVTIEPDTINVIGTELVPTELGVTPFQNALFTRNFLITKRQKFRIPVGDEISFVLNDRRSRTFSIQSSKPYAWDKSTTGIFVQFYGVSTNANAAAAAQVATTCTRRYRMKFMDNDNANDARVS